jgi:uncharacterized protein (TIGR00369 family)
VRSEPTDPGYAERVRVSFGKQGLLETVGASLVRVAPGEVEIALPVSPAVSQQHGFVHGGAVAAIADSAAGYAALTLMPATAGVLTAEFKINFLAAASGERLVALGRVVKAGRTLTVAQAEVLTERGGERAVVALLTATLVVVEGREGIAG